MFQISHFTYSCFFEQGNKGGKEESETLQGAPPGGDDSISAQLVAPSAVPAAASDPVSPPGNKDHVLTENWANFSRYISLDISAGTQILACRFCGQAFTVDRCKALIQHLQAVHLSKTTETQIKPSSTQVHVVKSTGGQTQPVTTTEPLMTAPHMVETTEPQTKPSSQVLMAQTKTQQPQPRDKTMVLSEEVFRQCSEIVSIGGTDLWRCRYCGVVYSKAKLDRFRGHLLVHYRDSNCSLPPAQPAAQPAAVQLRALSQ